MKQKIVMKVQMGCEKCRKKALKIAAGTDGVMSVALQGDDRDQIVVVGNNVDSAGLCTTLRKKKVGNVILLSVEEVKDPKPEAKKTEEEKKPEEKKPEEKKPEEKKAPGEEKKPESKEGQQEAKKSDSNPPPSAAVVTNSPPMCPYYHYPPPHYYNPNPQYYMCSVPPDDNQGCNIM